MEQPVVIITITEVPFDSERAQLMIKTEFHPPIERGDTPTVAQAAAMVALNAIKDIAEGSGGGITDIQTFKDHSGPTGWWS